MERLSVAQCRPASCGVCDVRASYVDVPQKYLDSLSLGQFWERFAALGAVTIDDVLDPEAFTDAEVRPHDVTSTLLTSRKNN